MTIELFSDFWDFEFALNNTGHYKLLDCSNSENDCHRMVSKTETDITEGIKRNDNFENHMIEESTYFNESRVLYRRIDSDTVYLNFNDTDLLVFDSSFKEKDRHGSRFKNLTPSSFKL